MLKDDGRRSLRGERKKLEVDEGSLVGHLGRKGIKRDGEVEMGVGSRE